jgi:acetyl-CoA carboxylase carboxyl transferase subunit beta
MLGDVHIAEPGATIGFAGARVIEETIRQTLPEGFQTAEYLLEHGMIDMVVPRPRLRETLIRVIGLLRRQTPTAAAAAPLEPPAPEAEEPAPSPDHPPGKAPGDQTASGS